MNPTAEVATKQRNVERFNCVHFNYECSLCGVIFTDPNILHKHLEQIHRVHHTPQGVMIKDQPREIKPPQSYNILKLNLHHKHVSTIDRGSPVLDKYYFEEINSFSPFHTKIYAMDLTNREKAFSDTLSRPPSHVTFNRDLKDSPAIELNTFYNTTKDTWDCGICRKSFKEKNDLYQHLRSATHEARRFSCTECGKAFSSVGALTQHMEQPGHSRDNKSLTHDLAQLTDATNGNHIPSSHEMKLHVDDRNLILPRGFIFNGGAHHNPATSYSDGHRMTPFPAVSPRPLTSPNDMAAQVGLWGTSMNNGFAAETVGSSNSMPQHSTNALGALGSSIKLTGKEIGECSLYFGGVVIPRTLIGSCGWVIKDDTKDEIVCEGAHSVDLIYPESVRAEYEGLLAGVIEAVNRRIKVLRVVSDNELIFLHLNNGSGLLCCQSVYRITDDITRRIREIRHNFAHIRFQLVPPACNDRARQLARNHMRLLQARESC